MSKEILKAVVFCHRVVDDKDFLEKIICIPPERADYLVAELEERANNGVIDTVQLGRAYIQAEVRTPYFDECDKFLMKLDKV